MYCLEQLLGLCFSDRRLLSTSSSRIKMDLCVVIILGLAGIVSRNKRERRGLLLLYPVYFLINYWVKELLN